ncbi:3-deoxy-D-manno-octulosonic acid transferase [Leptospirillum ferriphilum]|uniref:3-deoxy-D-manno-octulosonic acid transferase n=1 Tax=Leptospirillum ferriphilum TaxID=178606 RepID=UPI0011D26744|nr:glycosyltransferase [Leptospirillum ferriphilum]
MEEKNVLHGHLFLSLLDTYGELRALTVLADLVVVGGTFDPVGGHSPIDAAAAGIPLVSGPNVDHIREVVQDLSDGGGMIQLPGPDLLSALLLEQMKSPEKREKMGQKNREVFAAQRGALQRTMELLKPFLEEMSPPPKRTDL